MSYRPENLGLFPVVSKTFVLKFGVDSHSVDAELLARSILACKRSICAAAIASAKGGRVNVAVDGVKEGSVEVQLTVSVECAGDNIDPVDETMRIVSGQVEVYRFLGGNPMLSATPLAGGLVELKNIDDGVCHVEQAVYRSFIANNEPPIGDCSMCEELGVKSISILDASNVPLVVVQKADFHDMVRQVATFKNIESTVRVTPERLRIAVLPLESPRNAWGFVLGEERISANIKDEEFISKIEKNEMSFSQGDLLCVDLRVEKKVDLVSLKETKRKYTVVKVLDTEHRPQQAVML